MHRGTRDVITVRKRERVAFALLDPDSAGYDEMVRQLEEQESFAADGRSEQDEGELLRRVVALRIGADPDEVSMPESPIPGAMPKTPA